MIRAPVLAAVLAVILLVTIRPWYGFVGHSHWQLVEWMPFSAGVRPFDIIANVTLFVPLGAVLAWRREGRRGRAVFFATLAGALLSLAIELYQVYCHGHFPTMTDVLTNTSGTLLGAWYGGSNTSSNRVRTLVRTLVRTGRNPRSNRNPSSN